MNQYKFSRAAAIVSNTYFKKYEERYAFAQACDRAISLNPDNPLEVLDPAYQKYFDQEVRVHPKAQAAENILRHLPGKHNQKTHGVGRLKFGTSTNARVYALAHGVAKKAAASEPQITNLMEQLADENTGELVGLENRLKGISRIDEKIKSDALQDYDGDFEAAAANIGDSVRYTMKLDESNYSQGVVSTIESLNDAGYKTRVKNFWQENNTYKGVNAVVTSPNGQIFELQFHTLDSLVVKEINHQIYEVTRTGSMSIKDIYELDLEQANNWLSINTPKNLNLLDSVAKSVARPPVKPL
jgi:hypothetical protein